MSTFLEKNHRIFAIIGSIVIIGVIFTGLLFGPLNIILPDAFREKLGYSTETIASEINIQLIINFNGFHTDINQSIEIPSNETATAYSILLHANLTVEIEEHSYGIYIKSIEGISEGNNYFWWYLVDGEASSIAANRFDLRQNNASEVNWVYRSF